MNLLAMQGDPSPISIAAALIPSISFLLLLLYYTMIGSKKNPRPKIVRLQEPIKVIGVATKTSAKTFVEDDRILWKEYKLMKEKGLIKNKKEEHSFLAVKKVAVEGESWEYVIGNIVYDLNNIPTGLKGIEIPVNTYAAFHIQRVNDEKVWAEAIIKIEKYIFEKWLPKSEYQLDPNSIIREIEYHDKRNPNVTRNMIFYIPICKK